MVALERVAVPTALAVIGVLDRAFDRHGRPDRLLTDNGGQLTSFETEAFLVERGVEPWMELPLWIPGGSGFDGMLRADVSGAVAAGLTFRPIQQTIRDTAEWDATRGDYEPAAGLPPERERELLEAWRTRS
jgi:hypothetical protein